MAAALSSRPMRAPYLRFSLGGMMFIFVFGVSVGLAYWRFPWVNLSGALLASFTTWFLLGITQRLKRDCRRLRQSYGLSPEVRWGVMLQIAMSIGIVAVLAIAAGINFYCGEGSVAGIAWNGRPAASSAANVLFFLAVMGAYWSPPLAKPSTHQWLRVVRPIYEFMLMAVAAFWAAKVIVEWMLIVSLVQIAIRGVEAHQPVLWAGRVLNPASSRPPPTGIYYERLLLAFTLLAIAGGASALALHHWGRGWRLRVGLLTIAAPCALAAMWLIAWWSQTGFAQLSPYFATAISQNVGDLLPLIIILGLVLAAALAFTLTVTRRSDGPASAEADAPHSPVLLHEHLSVVGLCIFAILVGIGTQIWNLFVANYFPTVGSMPTLRIICWTALSCLREFATGRAEEMIGLAAALVLTSFVWRRIRVSPVPSGDWLVDPAQFLATCLLSVATIFLVGPIVVWAYFGCALAPIRV